MATVMLLFKTAAVVAHITFQIAAVEIFHYIIESVVGAENLVDAHDAVAEGADAVQPPGLKLKIPCRVVDLGTGCLGRNHRRAVVVTIASFLKIEKLLDGILAFARDVSVIDHR